MKTEVALFNTFVPVVPIWEKLSVVLSESASLKFICLDDAYKGRASRSEPNSDAIHLPRFLSGKTAFAHLYFTLMGLIKVIRLNSDRYVFFTQPPFFFVLAGFICRLKKKPYSVHVMDLHPDIFSPSGLLKADGFVYRVLDRLKRRALYRADSIFVIGRCMSDLLVSQGVDAAKIHLIRNLPASDDCSEAMPDIELYLQNTYQIAISPDQTLVYYSGNMGLAHEFETLLETAKETPKAVYILSGGGRKKKQILAEKERLGLVNVFVIDYLDLPVYRALIARANLYFVSLAEGYTGMVVPSKYYSAIAEGAIVVFQGSSQCELARDLLEQKSGYVISRGDTGRFTALVNACVGSSEPSIRKVPTFESELQVYKQGLRL